MDWQTLRNQFMRQVGGDLPGNHLEQELINAYEQHPTAVERSLEKIALAFKAGKIRSPWGAAKAEVAKAVDAANNPTHDKSASRHTAIQRAEQWIRAAGLHYDRETETIDELYGDRGRLRHHPNTQPRLLELWNEIKPLGVIAEQEAVERGIRHQQQRAQLQAETPQAAKPIGNIEVKDGITIKP
jgi:hypothetical protein